MAAAGYDIGASSSASSGALGGRTGDINITGGGGGGLASSLLPKLTPDKAWIGWAVAAVVAVLIFFGFTMWVKRR